VEREYREHNLAKVGMKGIFPPWQNSQAEVSSLPFVRKRQSCLSSTPNTKSSGKITTMKFDDAQTTIA